MPATPELWIKRRKCGLHSRHFGRCAPSLSCWELIDLQRNMTLCGVKAFLFSWMSTIMMQINHSTDSSSLEADRVATSEALKEKLEFQIAGREKDRWQESHRPHRRQGRIYWSHAVGLSLVSYFALSSYIFVIISHQNQQQPDSNAGFLYDSYFKVTGTNFYTQRPFCREQTQLYEVFCLQRGATEL